MARVHRENTPQDEHTRLIRHGRASMTRSIASAVVIKREDLFFVSEPSGDVPMTDAHGFGLYYHDCRYLNGYVVRLFGRPLESLGVDASAGFRASFELTNPDLHGDDDDHSLIAKETLGLTWERTIDVPATRLVDVMVVNNFGSEPLEVPLSVAVRARFEALFDVRGTEPRQRGTLHPPAWRDEATLVLQYDGADEVTRRLVMRFDPAPSERDEERQDETETTATFVLRVPARERSRLAVEIDVQEESQQEEERKAREQRTEDLHQHEPMQRSSDAWIERATRVRTDSRVFDTVFDRALRDLHLLTSTLRGHRYFAAGVPWYVTPLGRDSLIAALETLANEPWMAEETLRLLATLQGTADDDWRDEEPGKMMHELRVGEMARLGEIPQTPYYGSVDATPLFLLLLIRHAQWTGRLDLFRELRPHVEAALAWIDRNMRQSGFLSYDTTSSRGLANQGWKDSGDAISNHDGSLATSPIALIEVQGYVYAAKKGLADLYRRSAASETSGDQTTSQRLDQEADQLRDRVNEQFWREELGTYAIALQRDNRLAEIVSSNPGHALWTGLATKERAARTADRLLQPDMFSGWGIRTLSTRERRYNPIGYHLGTVWPHDNAIAAAGFRRFGNVDAVVRVITGMIEAAVCFEHDRLPEVFAGFDRHRYSDPIHYPVACHPQAWAAGAVPCLLESALGLEPDGFARRLIVHPPVLPSFIRRLTVENLPIADARARLVFQRDDADQVLLVECSVTGQLDVRTVSN